MQKPAYIIIAVPVIAFAAWAIWPGICHRGPVYQGKPLGYWVRQEPWRSVNGKFEWNLPTPDARAIPFLIDYVEKPRTAFGPPYNIIWDRLPGWLQRHLPKPDNPKSIRLSAIEMLSKMGPTAKPAFPVLIRILREEKDESTWRSAAYVLQPFAIDEPCVNVVLKEYGRRFRIKVTQDRVEESAKLLSLLPTRSMIFQVDASTRRIVGYRPPPLYKLSKEQLLGILGEPDTSDNNTIVYTLGNYIPNHPDWHSWLHFLCATGYVYESMVLEGPWCRPWNSQLMKVEEEPHKSWWQK